MRMEHGLLRHQMAALVWEANAHGFPLNADDEHALCQATHPRPDDWEYLPNLAWDAQDWCDSNVPATVEEN